MKILPVNLAPLAAFDALAPRRKVLLVGEGASDVLSYVVARRACERMPVRIVCGDNRFNPYRITRYARSQGIRPADALRAILIARAFTAFQLVELIQRLDVFTGDFLIITGVCSAFFDEDLTDTEAARLFYRAYWKLHGLAQSGVSVLLVETGPLPVERRKYFLKDLVRSSEVVLSLGNGATFTLDQQSNPGGNLGGNPGGNLNRGAKATRRSHNRLMGG